MPKMTTVTIRADITLSYSAWDKIVRRNDDQRKKPATVDQYIAALLEKARKVEVHRLLSREEAGVHGYLTGDPVEAR